MTTYADIKEYLMSSTSDQEKMDKYIALQDALFAQMEANITGQEVESYEIDDGQSKIKTVIKDFSKLVATYDSIEVLKERLFNNSIGGVIVLRDAKSIKSLR